MKFSLSLLSLGLLAPLLVVPKKLPTKESVHPEETKLLSLDQSYRLKGSQQTQQDSYKKRYQSFVHTPRVHFIYETLNYVFFIALFSYTMLCEFNYFDKKILTSNTTNWTSPGNYSEFVQIDKSHVADPSKIEWMLVFWMFASLMPNVKKVLTKLWTYK